uniref:nicotinate phosphoribosyltransferase n=1 Tax=Henneguya salminicola TaxID=69463 RepID=A0A6G3MGL8_HENSL
MNYQKHEINVFGIGTNLVTCASQPSLGMVYKLVENDKNPTFKLSEDILKSYIPFKKMCYRFFNKEGLAVLDYLTLWDEEPPKPMDKILCYHPYHIGVKTYIIPSKIQTLTKLVFTHGSPCQQFKTFENIRNEVKKNVKTIRPDHLRYINPTPYKVSLSEKLYNAHHSCNNNITVLE